VLAGVLYRYISKIPDMKAALRAQGCGQLGA